MLASPFLIDCYYVLNLWLGLVPNYAVPLCRISLLYGMLTIINSTVLAGIHATGRIKKYHLFLVLYSSLLSYLHILHLKWGLNLIGLMEFLLLFY